MASPTRAELSEVAKRLVLASPELELLLAAATDHEPQARKAWADWRETYPIDAMGIQAMKLLPLAMERVRKLGIRDPEEERLRGIERFMWLKTEMLVEGARQAALALKAQGISIVAIKGVGLRGLVGDALGPRTMADADLCVAKSITEEKFRSGVRALEDTGFQVRLAHPHAVTLTKGEMKIDLHRVAMREDPRFDAMEWARPCAEPFLVLDATAALVVSVVHGIRQDGGLLWVMDLVALIQTGKIQWHTVEYFGESRCLTLALEAALARAADTNDRLAAGHADVHRVPHGVFASLWGREPSYLELKELAWLARGERRGAEAGKLLAGLRASSDLVTAEGLRKWEKQKGHVWDQRWLKEWA